MLNHPQNHYSYRWDSTSPSHGRFMALGCPYCWWISHFCRSFGIFQSQKSTNPICSMYGIFTYMMLVNIPATWNVKWSIWECQGEWHQEQFRHALCYHLQPPTLHAGWHQLGDSMRLDCGSRNTSPMGFRKGADINIYIYGHPLRTYIFNFQVFTV